MLKKEDTALGSPEFTTGQDVDGAEAARQCRQHKNKTEMNNHGKIEVNKYAC